MKLKQNNDWLFKKGEDLVEYEDRISSEINLQNIKKRFDYKIFRKKLHFSPRKQKSASVFEAIQEACGADEYFWQILARTHSMYYSFVQGYFFDQVSDGEMDYIPVAEWIVYSDEGDDPESARQVKYGLIKFKNPLSYIMVVFSYIFPDGNDFWTTFPIIRYDSKKKLKINEIRDFISKEIKSEFSSLRNIYLNKKFKWNLKKFVKDIPASNTYDITTKLWITNYEMKYYNNSWKLKFHAPFIRKKPDFTKKFSL